MGTIFVAGTYGVGKSTLCNKLSTALKIPDFSAGDLISAVNGETYGANKVVRDKDANQNILASQVKQLLKSTPSIILAGHFCIFDINGNVDTLPSRVFYDLEIETILLLEASASQIIKNLSMRDKKEYSESQILLGCVFGHLPEICQDTSGQQIGADKVRRTVAGALLVAAADVAVLFAVFVLIPLLIQHMAAVGAEQNPGEQPHFIVAVRAFALFA